MKQIIYFILLSLITTNSSYASSSMSVQLEQNKKIVQDFFEIAFNKHKPSEAVKKHMGTYYTQHNPYAADGAKAFIDFFESRFKKYPESRITIKRTIAEKDLVVVHLHAQNSEKDLGRAVVDIMRIENGKIVEHWDVVQDVLEKPANTNTMF